MPLLDLPPDILLSIADFLPESALNAFLQTSSSLYVLLNASLYRYNVRYSHSSALLWASLYGREAVVRRLLSHSADVNTTVRRRRRGTNRKNKGSRTMENGESTESQKTSCSTPLVSPLVHAAAGGYVDIMALLIQHGADIHGTTPTSPTTSKTKRTKHCRCHSIPVMTAAAHGHVPALNLLLHHGVDINAPQASCNTPLSLAAINGHIPAIQTLLHHGAVVNTTRRGTTPLIKAIQANQPESVRILLTQGNADLTIPSHHPQRFTPLFWAVSKNNPVIISLLLNHAPDAGEIERRDSIGRTPLALAAWEERIEALETLLHHGADINAPNRVGQTPLWWAVLTDSIPASTVLLRHGADAGVVAPLDDENEVMPVLLAAMRRFHYALAEVLLDHGVEPNCRAVSVSGAGGKGVTPLLLAVERREHSLVRKLLQHGADPNMRSGRCDSTPLYHAIAAGHVSITTMLLDHGADPNALVKLTGKRKGRISPLCWALKCRQYAIARCLVDHGADVECPSVGGRSLLVKAVGREDVGLTMAMLRCGARNGIEEALDLARLKGNSILQRLLNSI